MVDSEASRGFEPILVELQRLYPLFMNADIDRNVREGWQEVSYLAHGWYMRCYRGIQCLLLLDLAGHAEEASPIRRSIIEHTVALQWLTAEGDSILDTVARGHAFTAKRQRDAIETAQWTSIKLSDVDTAIASTEFELRDSTNDNLLQFTERVKRYSDVHTMTTWLSEVARSHPSYESAICYVTLPDGLLRQTSRDAIWQVPFATTWLFEALLTIRKIFVDPPWPELLGRIGDRYKTVTNNVRVEQGLQPIDWPTGQPVTNQLDGSSDQGC